MNMTKALVILLAIAIVLGVVAFFAVFSPGTYVTGSSSPTSASGTLSFSGLANESGTPSSSDGTNSTSTNVFANGTTTPGIFATTYSYPYVESWTEGQNDFSITGAAFDGSQLTLGVKVQVGNVGGCIPVNMGLVTDESGDLQSAIQSNFTFPDTNSCNGTPNATYQNQELTFVIASKTPTPWLFTTGGTSNQFFQISTTTNNGLQIQLPATTD
jgi:hypothetical protein